ncbi:hypothetical protein MKK68_19555 [Methylobacterium sp. E-016]|uniref:hypothetical protein n=1 Tax=Methylobacterium sp. E-016 TaxID=2836556 RepID=UPI001FBB54FB|nr:hypothetical protein [Methylobacterium sp. E-016]MCJ2077813.1 hypothetical protein [Methylobacterium sp. E-016]
MRVTIVTGSMGGTRRAPDVSGGVVASRSMVSFGDRSISFRRKEGGPGSAFEGARRSFAPIHRPLSGGVESRPAIASGYAGVRASAHASRLSTANPFGDKSGTNAFFTQPKTLSKQQVMMGVR